MSLSGSRLSDAIHDAIVTCYGTPHNDQKLRCFCNAVANSVVNEIINHAVVETDGADPQGGNVHSVGTVTS